MTRTSIQALIVCTSLSLISAMPFLDTEDGLQKYDEDRYIAGLDTDQTRAEINPLFLQELEWPTLSLNEQYAVLSKLKNILHDSMADEQQGISENIHSNSLMSDTREKRFGFRYPLFARNSRVNQRNIQGLLKKMYVASRGKRRDEGDFNENSYYGEIVSPVKRRRQGFTALRG